MHLSLFFAQKQTCFCIAHKVLYFSVFPEVADEPAAEKPAAEKQGSSNDRGKCWIIVLLLSSTTITHIKNLNLVCRSRSCKSGNWEEKLFDQSMGREWKDKSWEQVCCLPLSIPLNSFSVEPLFVRNSRCIFAKSILQLSIILSSRELEAFYKYMWMIFLALRPG